MASGKDPISPINSQMLEELGIPWYSSDTLPIGNSPSYITPEPTGFMLNWEKSTEPGSHWVACKTVMSKDLLMHFDPLGLPEHQAITKLFNSKAKDGMPNYREFKTNLGKPCQRPDDVICGHLCILWLKNVYNGFQFDKFIKKYEDLGK